MRKRIAGFTAICLSVGMILTGCGTTDISSYVHGNGVGSTYVEDGKLTEEEILRLMPWTAYEKTENKNKDMENIYAWDVVNDIRIGWCLGNTLDAYSQYLSVNDATGKFETAWGNPVTTQEMIDDVIAAGFNGIRIPVTWSGHLDSDYNISETWMSRVQEVVDYAYSRDVYVILNLHHETWNYTSYENVDEAIYAEKKIWSQIAERFKDYDEHLIFEAQNEPRKIGTSVEWTGGDKEGREVVNMINEAFVETIRNSGGSNPYRELLLPTYAASSEAKAIKAWEAPDDDRIIVSIHAYLPYHFALDQTDKAKDRWDGNSWDIDVLMKNIQREFLDKGIPVIIGEFGAVRRIADEETRLEWVRYYLEAATEKGIPCFWWDNNLMYSGGENFGLYERNSRTWDSPELIQRMMEVTAPRIGDDAYIFTVEEYELMLEEREKEEENE